MNMNPIKWFYAFLFVLMLPFLTAKADVVDDVTALLKAANTKDLAKYLAPSVEVTILTEENTYTRAQTEVALTEFFSKHNPASVKIVHRLTSNPNYRFAVIVLNTDKGSFRTSVSFNKNAAGKFLLSEIRIETNEE